MSVKVDFIAFLSTRRWTHKHYANEVYLCNVPRIPFQIKELIKNSIRNKNTWDIVFDHIPNYFIFKFKITIYSICWLVYYFKNNFFLWIEIIDTID